MPDFYPVINKPKPPEGSQGKPPEINNKPAPPAPPRPRGKIFHASLKDDLNNTYPIELEDGGGIVLGMEGDLVVPNAACGAGWDVSGRHARISRGKGGWTLTPLEESEYGTSLEDGRVLPPGRGYPLNNRGRFLLGKYALTFLNGDG